MSSRTGRHTIVPITPRRRLSARSRPLGVTPGHPDLRPSGRPSAADAGRRLEAIVALEARRAEGRRLDGADER